MPLQQTVEETAVFGRALDEVFIRCANDAACNAAYPQLADQFRAAVERLNAQPVMLRVQVQRNGALMDFPMDGQLFANILFLQLYSPANIPFVPFMIKQVEAGNGQVMTIPAAQTLRLLSAGADTGDRFSVTCQDIVPFAPAEDGTQSAQAYPHLSGIQIMTSWSIRPVCESWGVPAASSDFSQPVNSDIPTLLLHGQYDPRLTTDYAFQVAQTLPNSYAYIVPGVSHQATFSSCAQSIAVAFIGSPTQEPATGCLAEVTAPQFVLPGDLHATPAMMNLVNATMEPLNPLMLGLVVICLLVFIAALIGAVRGKAQTRTIRWLSALVALLGLVALLTLIAIILATLTSGALIGFGIPGSVALIRFLPLVAGAFAVALAVMTVLQWLSRIPGSTRSVVFTSGVAIAGLFVSAWLLTLGFLP
jgi:hypothetical protein